jgi:hypothetical protein
MSPTEELRQKVMQVAALTSALVALVGTCSTVEQVTKLRALVLVADDYADESLALADRVSRLASK